MQNTVVANKYTYLGLLLITLSILMDEILLTRIFSVITYYHFAFMAISIVMFGMAVGSMLVYLLPQYQQQNKTNYQLAYTSFLFSITVVLSFFVLARTPINFEGSLEGVLQTIAIYLLLAVPFIFGGMAVCLALTKFSKQINSLYAADLIGAGLGCVLIIVVLNYVTGPIAVVVTALFGLLSTLFFAKNMQRTWLGNLAFCSMLVFIALIAFNDVLKFYDVSPLRLVWVKNEKERLLPYEKWNSFSRITIGGNPDVLRVPFTQGKSNTYQFTEKVRGMFVTIDASAATFLMNYHNDPNEINFLKYDITGFANYIKPNADILIIGVGGGRDVLTALAFNQHAITGIELNPIIIDLLKNQYDDFSGHLNENPKVHLVNAEARSFVAQSKDRFDIIQISLIDTWAATAAGAYVLSENSLFTTQAWQNFLTHINPEGVLTVTRWYIPDNPTELYRLTALASQSLRAMGIADTASHIMVFANDGINLFNDPKKVYVGNVIVSPSPFSQETILAAEDMARSLNYSILFTPNHRNNPTFSALASNQDVTAIGDKLGIDISAPTDDKPFFFETLKFNKYFQDKLWRTNSYYLNNNPFISASRAITILIILLITVVVLTLSCIIMPLMLKKHEPITSRAWPLLVYFSSIGLGFMFIEIAQLQRFVLFLGTPTYGLSVILFGLLTSSGVGSLISVNFLNSKNKLILSQFALLLTLAFFAFYTTPIITYFQASVLYVRILVSLAVICSMGIFMGSALPLGLRLAAKYSPTLTPWLWGINGATSICGSVLAMIVALCFGIHATYLSGIICYGSAFFTIYYLYTQRSTTSVHKYSSPPNDYVQSLSE